MSGATATAMIPGRRSRSSPRDILCTFSVLEESMTTVNSFAHQQKSDAVYLDIAANDHGDEKGALVHRAITRMQTANPHLVEIGPGGGAAVKYLASKLTPAAGPG